LEEGVPVQDLKNMSLVSDFQRMIGVDRIEAAEGRCSVWLDSKKGAHNPKGDVHGGALAALCDMAMARAVRSANLELWGLSTVSLTINYLEPVGGDVTAHARMTKNGGTLAFAEVEILSGDGARSIHATGVFRKIREKRA
jgi:uncharacterized protein (TIGR00369 family)